MTTPQKPRHPDTLDVPDEVIDGIFRRHMEIEAADDPDGFGFHIVRATPLILATNDPALPAPPTATPGAKAPAPGSTGEPNSQGSVGIAERHPGANPRRATGPKARTEQKDDDVIGGRDRDGDKITLGYIEQDCDEHGLEAFVVIAVNEHGYVFPGDELPALINWLAGKYRESKRTE